MPFITLITSRKLIPRLTIYGQLASCDVLGQRLIHGLAFGAVASQPLRLVDESVVEGQIGRHLQSPTPTIMRLFTQEMARCWGPAAG